MRFSLNVVFNLYCNINNDLKLIIFEGKSFIFKLISAKRHKDNGKINFINIYLIFKIKASFVQLIIVNCIKLIIYLLWIRDQYRQWKSRFYRFIRLHEVFSNLISSDKVIHCLSLVNNYLSNQKITYFHWTQFRPITSI